MFNKIKNHLAEYKEKRYEKQRKPWSKKQKFIFLAVLTVVILYLIISSAISGKQSNESQGFVLPNINLSVNGLDMALLGILAIGFIILKIRSYVKNKKGKDNNNE